jgi:penicillin-binding protein 1A
MADGNETYGPSKPDSTVNYGWQALRPTGSAFKVYTLAAALNAGIQPTSEWKGNSPLTIPNCGGGDTWTVHNSEGNLPGFHPLTTATADSINVVFAQVINAIGPQAVVDMARRMGVLGGHIPAVCPTTIGDVEISPLAMTSGVTTLANQGIHCMPFAISKVVRAGKRIYKAQPECKRAIPQDIAAQETHMLEQVICCGTASGRATLTPARPEAGKTGTDTDFKNAYFVGYVPQIATGVWVGYAAKELAQKSIAGDHGRAGFGADAAAPIWTQVMDVAVANLPVEQFPAPPAPKSGTVPNVVGMDKQTAIDTLVKAQFTPNPVDGPCVRPKGTVCDQTPGAGATAPLGTSVTFTVSNGKTPQAPVPDVVGMPRGAAATTLRTAGFVVNVQFQDVTDPKQNGIVLDERPPGGTNAVAGSTVTIIVGKLVGTPTPSPSPTARPAGGEAPGGNGAASGSVSWYLGSALLVPAGLAAALRRRTRRRPR